MPKFAELFFCSVCGIARWFIHLFSGDHECNVCGNKIWVEPEEK